MGDFPEHWSLIRLDELLTHQQIRDIGKHLRARTLTEKKLEEIINSDTKKMEGKAVPKFLVHYLMYMFGVKE